MTQEQFTKFPNKLYAATQFTYNNHTVELSSNMKIVWLYMHSRWEFFQTKNGYYENQDVIAVNTGIGRLTLIKILKQLESAEILVVQRKKLQGRKESNTYTTVVSPFDVEYSNEKTVVERPYKPKVVETPVFEEEQDYSNMVRVDELGMEIVMEEWK